jgi:hypothetical protein
VKRAETAPARSATTTRRDGIAQPPARDASSAAAIGRAGHHANDPAPIEVENTQVKVDIKIDQKKAR